MDQGPPVSAAGAVTFAPFHRMSRVKPPGVIAAFLVAFAVKVVGIPFSMFLLGLAFGVRPPGCLFRGQVPGQYSRAHHHPARAQHLSDTLPRGDLRR